MSLVSRDTVIVNGAYYCPPSSKSIVSEFLTYILEIIDKINSLPSVDLSPGFITNSLFSALVAAACIDDLNEDEILSVLSNSDILKRKKRLMEQCVKAKYLLETTYAREIKAQTKTIKDFPYYDSYVSLAEFEMESLNLYKNISTSHVIATSHVAVIGSGPLPLTTVEMLKHLPESVAVTHFDHSEEAIELSKSVVNYNQNLFVKKRTALEITANDLSGVDLVHLVDLVGDEKKDVFNHLYNVMQPGSIVMVRSAIGLKTLLYKRLSTLECGRFSNLLEFHPEDKNVMNSVICGIR